MFLIFEKTNLISTEQLTQLIKSNWTNELFEIWSRQIEIDRERYEEKIDENVKLLSSKIPKEFEKTFENNWFWQVKSIIKKKNNFKTSTEDKQKLNEKHLKQT